MRAEAVSTIADVVTAIAALVGGGAAWRALYVWRDQLIWGRRLALAEELHELFFDAASALNWIRTPWLATFAKRPDAAPDDEGKQYLPYLERLNEKAELFGKLQTIRFRAVALFGPQAKEPFEQIATARRRVESAAFALSSQRFWSETGEDREKKATGLLSDLQGTSLLARSDEISVMINQAVQGAEELLKSVIRQESIPARLRDRFRMTRSIRE